MLANRFKHGRFIDQPVDLYPRHYYLTTSCLGRSRKIADIRPTVRLKNGNRWASNASLMSHCDICNVTLNCAISDRTQANSIG